MPSRRFTLAHVTHEAVEKIGGIGAVLEGLMISPVYQEHVRRSILVGPTSTQIAVDPEARLGEGGQVLYSSIDNIDRANLGAKLRPVEWAFNVAIVYGKRKYESRAERRKGEAEVLLIDVFRANPDRLNVFKFKLWQTFGIDSGRYESAWDFEEYARLAEPAFYALRALLKEEDLPCVLFSHEFMGMPAALQAILEGRGDFRTVFHAHECASARRLVETHPGHDVMFYNVMREARARGKYMADIFGDQDHLLRHALVRRSHLCDGIIAVGDPTRDELKFLGREFDDRKIDLVYNGLPAMHLTAADKEAARKDLLAYSTSLLGSTPDVLMTHVTRPVISKGLWRDLTVCHFLDAHLQQAGRTAVLYILTSGGGTRRVQDVTRMEEYGWPRSHREGYPDLVGPEVDIYRDIEAFNRGHQAVQVVLVNQFGWSQERIGRRLSKNMDMSNLRVATDVEFGMATYEPFGISPLEPLGCGALCVISAVCGCKTFVDHVTNGQHPANVIAADFTFLPQAMSMAELLGMGRERRDELERAESQRVAREIFRRLPTTPKGREALLQSGRALVARMGWDTVVKEGLVPLLDRLQRDPQGNRRPKGSKG